MRRYISNKGLRITFQRDRTRHLPGSDLAVMTIQDQALIECVFQPLIGGEYGITPHDLPTAYEAYAKVIGEVQTFANVRENFDPELGTVTTPMRREMTTVPVYGFNQGRKKLGVVKGDETVIETDGEINPAEGLWVFDVDVFCRQNMDAKGREDEIEEFLDDSVRSGRDHVKIYAPVMAPPLPGYERLKTAKRIAMLAAELGVSPQSIVAYETENPRELSEEILEEMAKLLAKAEDRVEEAERELVVGA